MKKADIVVGGKYLTRVSGSLAEVVVTSMEVKEASGYYAGSTRSKTIFHVRRTDSNRELIRSAAALRPIKS